MNKRLNILYVPFWYPPHGDQPVQKGTFVREQVVAASMYDDIHILLLRTEEKSFKKTQMESYRSNGIDVIDITPPVTESQFRNTLYRRALWLRGLAMAIRRWGKPDLIHCQDMSSFYAGPSAKKMGIPYVVSQHWSGFAHRLVYPSTRRKCKASFNGAKVILTTHRAGKDDLRHYDIKGDIRWIPNSFDGDVFNPDNISQERGDLLHVSDFSQDSRVKSVIEAFSHILPQKPDTVLHLVGDNGKKEIIEQFASRILPPDSFKLHGVLSREQRAQLMRASLGFIYPVRESIHSCYLMEAIACGCPPLASKQACEPLAIADSDVLPVKSGDINAISLAMIKLLNGNHCIDTLKSAQSVHDRFSRRKIGQMIHECHIDALKS